MSSESNSNNYIFVPHVFGPTGSKKDKTTQKLVSKYAMINRVRSDRSSPASSRSRRPSSPVRSHSYGSLENDFSSSFSTFGVVTPPKSPPESSQEDISSNKDNQHHAHSDGVQLHSSNRPFSQAPDPFDTLPLTLDEHDQQLLHAYVTGQLLLPGELKGNTHAIQRISTDRMTVFFPVVMSSKIVLSAMMAYVELLINPSENGMPNYRVRQHLDNALSAVQPMLTDPVLALNDEVILTIYLLALVAQRMNDLDAFRAHAKGYVSLLRYRAMFNETPFAVDQFSTAGSHSSNSPEDFAQFSHRSSVLGALFQTSQVQLQPPSSRKVGLHSLARRRMISDSCKDLIDASLVWHQLVELSSHDLTHYSVVSAQHAWADGFASATEPTAFEHALQLSLHLATYLNSPLERESPGASVACLVQAIYAWLFCCDLKHLAHESPDALLWIISLIGPFSAAPDATRLRAMLRRLVDLDDRDGATFESTMDLFSTSFLWNVDLIPGARAFWQDSFGEW